MDVRYQFMLANDIYNLARFMEAQEPVYARVVAELTAGEKQSHWMWFIFPQLRGLGSSQMAQHYGIANVDEASAYLQHPVLGFRLRECTRLVCALQNRTLDEIFGYPDNAKFHSCVTLFNQATQNHIFAEALEKYFGRAPDEATLRLLDHDSKV